MRKIKKNRFKEKIEVFNVNPTFYDDPEFNVRILIPTTLKNLWMNKKVYYNVNMPYDNSVGPELFVDNSSLFIDVEAAIRSHKFMDEDEQLIDENYGELPDKIYAVNENGKFDDEFSFISCDDGYFNDPEEFSEGVWRLDWEGCDQFDFDVEYQDYFGEFPEDSTMSDEDFSDDDEDWDEEDEDADFEESSKFSKPRNFIKLIEKKKALKESSKNNYLEEKLIKKHILNKKLHDDISKLMNM